MQAESEIAKWYRGKAVFITGATGFMGKVLVAKLLRSCPDIGPIYILVREKKKMLPRDRVEQILTSAVFDEIRGMKTHRTDWLFPILGDVSLPDLGISAEDRRLLQEKVSVVFHLAATVRFDEPLRIATAINLVGTRALMELCLEMTNLSAIVHVSTAYANCIFSSIEERVYAPPADSDKVMHCVAGMDDELLDSITPRLIGNHPNTYTFTKALAENVVAGYSNELPIVVVRPSIVTACWREPNPGWIDGFSGTTAIVVGTGKGLLKIMHGNSRLVADMIPVDICINLILAAAWEIGTRENTKLVPNLRVYNCVSRPYKSISWGAFIHVLSSCIKKYPFSGSVVSSIYGFSQSRMKQTVINFLEQSLPATVADICIWLSGGKPRFRNHLSKLNELTACFRYFTTHEFEFDVENVEELKSHLNPTDRVIFNFDMTNMNWEEYIKKYFLGIRRHILHEKDDTIDACRQRNIRWNLLKNIFWFGAFGIIVAIGYFKICL